MTRFIKTDIGRLRMLAFFEGSTLLILILISMPLKYIYGITAISHCVGPVHGILFILYVIATISVSIAYQWSFSRTAWKVLLASLVPFGTFYIDHTILRPLHDKVAARP